MHQSRFYRTQLTRLIFQTLLYISLFVSFFGLLSISNPQLLNLSRTAATTMGVFAVCLLGLTMVYGGFEIGRKLKRSVFASLSLTIFFTDAISYLFLQIMNVNPQNPEANATLTLWGEDFYLLMCAFALQIFLLYVIISLAYFCYFRINPPRRCLIIASSQEVADHVAAKLKSFPQRYRLNEVVHYQCPDVLETILEHDTIFLAGVPDTEEGALKAFCYQYNKSMYLMAELEDVIISTAESTVLDDTPFLHIHRTEMTLMQRFLKRAFDIAFSLAGLVLFSPLLLVTAAALKLAGNGSVFFRQKRATINGNVFEIIKFRTMYEDDPRQQADSLSAREGDDRITPIGRFLRKYRIDELPQLLNVLRGEMSLVGPRPEMLENVEKYTREVPEFRYRQRMKAGLTGLAQIEGKYNTSPKDKAILDLLYIENFTLSYDFKLLLRTFTIFFRRDSTEGFGEKRCDCPLMRTEARSGREETEIPASSEQGRSDQNSFLRKAL